MASKSKSRTRERRTLEDVTADPAFRAPRAKITLRNYELARRRWNKAGVIYMDQVTQKTAADFVSKRIAEGYAPSSVSAFFYALLAIVDHEERAGRFDPDTQQQVRRCAPLPPRRRELCAAFMTPEQLERYCAGADDDLAAFLVRFACYTGLRASELSGLDWSDVDLGQRTLHVRRGKTGPRRVSLCEPAIDLLRSRMASGLAIGPVFGGASGKALLERVRRARNSSGVPVTLTLCRHTRASWWISAGVPVALVAKQLGHSVAVCLKYYGGLADTYNPILEKGAAG